MFENIFKQTKMNRINYNIKHIFQKTKTLYLYEVNYNKHFIYNQ